MVAITRGVVLSVVPAFELGVWNAWILIIPMLIIFFFDMRATAAREAGKSGDFQLSRKEKIMMNGVFLPMIVSFIYAVFLPLQLGTAWLYGGLAIFIFGIIFIVVTLLEFSTSPQDKVITDGLYRYSRNPMYIGLLLMQIGVGVACASWLHLLLTVALMIMLNTNLSSEERYCLYRFGDDYQRYKNMTPRWIGIPKPEEKEGT